MSTTPSSTDSAAAATTEKKGFRTRHLTLMGLGSAIGAGLFLGSGSIVRAAGPAAMVSYAIAGLVVLLVMRALAEMVASRPALGSFSTYATQAFGPNAGFTLGWLYWLMLMLVIVAEVSGAAAMLNALPEMVAWFPALPQWVWALVFVVAFGAVNLWGVRNFGEFEFWFSGIKVGTIVLFLAIGILMLLGILGDGTASVANIGAHGGFAPTGIPGIAAGLLAVMFSFGGIEIIAIAAAEADDPRAAIKAATRSIAYRILVFYIGSMFIIVSAIAWNDIDPEKSPFVEVMKIANVPAVATFIQIVAIAALLSSFNAQIYATSRMAYSLSMRGEGFEFLTKTTANDVPINAVILTLALSLGAVFGNWWLPGAIFTIALKYVGSALIVIWAFILLSQMKLHPEFVREGSLSYEMGGYPWLPALCLAGLLAFGGLMLSNANSRAELIGTLVSTAIIWALAIAHQASMRARGIDSAGRSSTSY